MQGAAVGGVLVAGGGVVISGPAHALGANPDPDPDSDGDDEGDEDDEWVNAV